MADVTLTIDGETGGVADAIKGVGTAATFGRREIGLLAISMQQAGVAIPGLNTMLYMLLNTALTPMAIGATAAIAALEGFRALFAYLAQNQQAAAETLSMLRQEYEAFVKLGDIADKMAHGRKFFGSAAGVAETAAAAAADTGVGREAAEQATESAASVAAGERPDVIEMQVFQKWLRLGYGDRYKSPKSRLRGFRNASKEGGFSARIDKEWEAMRSTAPQALDWRDESADLGASISPSAKIARVFEAEAKQNQRRGSGPQTAADVQSEFIDLVFAANNDYGGAREALQNRLKRRPELGDLAVRDKTFWEKGNPFAVPITEAKPGEQGQTVQVFIGTNLSIHPGQDVTDHGAPAQVRGPSE